MLALRTFLFIITTLFGLTSASDPHFDTREDGDDSMHPILQENATRESKSSTAELDASYWEKQAKDRLKGILAQKLNTNKAKNVIMFLGDGMSITTISAARIYAGQLAGASGEESQLSFEKFPTSGLAKTYCVNMQVPDSACTSTAYLTGVKGNYATVGVSARVKHLDCEQMQNISYHVDSLAKNFIDDRRSAGIVTTTRITHASPAGAYAHSASRKWEADADIKSAGFEPEKCRDISHQLIHGNPGKDLKVILGGGRREFRPFNIKDEEGSSGRRTDDRDLIQEWQDIKAKAGVEYEYVWNRNQLQNINSSTTYLMGLFEGDHCKFHLEANKTTEPTFEEMVEAAIKVLSKDDKGFFLFAEGGRIDHAHHSVHARMALDETAEFAKGIAKAVSMTDSEDTLIVVTSDHSHTMTIGGYSSRGNPIAGVNDRNKASDGLKYLTLSYANGKGYRKEVDGERADVTKEDMSNTRFRYPGMIPLSSETHGGEDVGVFARGPWNHIFTGVYEQNTIPHLIRYAACLDKDYPC